VKNGSPRRGGGTREPTAFLPPQPPSWGKAPPLLTHADILRHVHTDLLGQLPHATAARVVDYIETVCPAQGDCNTCPTKVTCQVCFLCSLPPPFPFPRASLQQLVPDKGDTR